MAKNYKKNIKIIQITDTHLFSNDTSEMFGVKSNLQFNKCLQKIKTEDLTDTDYIFLTGDISQDQSTESYRIIAELLSELKIPIYWIPGNHDDKAKANTVFSEYRNFFNARSLSIPNWRFIFLDTNLPGSGEGFLSQEEIIALKNEIDLGENQDNIAIVMHHHPIEVETPLMDQYILKNNNEFWDVISGSNVKLVICGHVHGDYNILHNGIVVQSSPATCFQLKKGTTTLSLLNEIGYKIHFFDGTHKAIAKVWE